MATERAYLLLVLEAALAEDDLLHALPVAMLLLKRSIGIEQLLGFGLGDLVQRVLVHHPRTLVLHVGRISETAMCVQP